MTSDLLTILTTIVLLAACIYGIQTKYRVWAVIVLVLSIPPILFSIIINIPIIASPLTPKVHGKIIDTETKKPLTGINIKAGWLVSSASVEGSSGGYYKLYKTKTDNNGEFVLPRGLKALNEYGLFGTRFFNGVNVTIYPSGYDYKVTRIKYSDKNKIEIGLDKVITDRDFIENIKAYWYGLYMMHKGSGYYIEDTAEKLWLKNAYYVFEKLYPYSKADTDYTLQELVSILDNLKEPDCIYLLQKLLYKYPNSSLTWYAKQNIKSYKKIYEIK